MPTQHKIFKFLPIINANPKDIQFTIICDEEKQQILTLEKLQSEKNWYFCLIND